MPEAMDLENAGRLAADAEYCAAALTALAEEGVLRMGEDVVVAPEELEAGAGMAEYVLGSVFPAGEATAPTLSTSAVALPSVIPDAFVPEYRMKVASSGGLRLRSGPGTDYESFAILPNETPIRCYAKQDEWIYVCYMGRYGWVAAEYCAEP